MQTQFRRRSGASRTGALRRAGAAGALAAVLLTAPGAAHAADVTGVYVAPTGEALHLKWADDEVVGRFVMKDRSFVLEGWLDDPGYMGMLYDGESDEGGLYYFVAAPVPEGMKFSMFTVDPNGQMDLEHPDRSWEMKRDPDRKLDVPPELVASLEEGDVGGTGADQAMPPDAGGAAPSGGGMPMPMDGTTPPGFPQSATPGAPAAGTGTGFQGPFHGQDGQGGITRLSFAQSGGGIQGELMAFGDIAQLSGTVHGGSAEGRIAAPNATGTFKATLSGAKLDLTMNLQTPNGPGTVPLSFQRGEPKEMAERDPRLVGTWNHSTSYTSGDFSAATSQNCVIRPDGTLTLYDGRVAGGGGAGSFDSGGGQGGVTSRWFTRGNILYVNGQPYARFGFNGNTLGLWFSQNGKPQLWSRQ